jgi:hypothetical protein
VAADALADSQTSPPSAPLLRARLVWLLVGIGVAVTLILVMYPPTARWWTRSRGEHLTLVEAQGRVCLDLPAEASDIRYYQHLRPDQVIVVDFAIPETAFLQWAVQQEWKPEPVVGSITIWPRSAFGDRATEVLVTNGFSYDTLQRGVPNTFSVTYDRATQRAYYEFSSEPLHGED